MIAAILESGELERVSTGLSLLVSAAADGREARALATFGALGALLDDDLLDARDEPAAAPHVADAGRAAFARTLAELRDTAAELPSAADLGVRGARVEATGAERAVVEARLDGVMSTPRFLREVGGRASSSSYEVGASLALLAVALAGCGTPSPDLFEVDRSGADRNANVTVVVNDGGEVTCNGKEHALDAKRLLAARQVLRDLEPQAELHLDLPRGPRQPSCPTASRMEAGTVAFSDTSQGQPRELPRARRVHEGRDRARVRAGARR